MDAERKQKQLLLAAQLEAEQNFPRAVLVGLVTSVVCAWLWAMVVYETGFAYSVMAIVLGAAVGWSVALSGRGIAMRFGWLAAGLSALGIALASMTYGPIEIAIREGMPVMEVALLLGPREHWALTAPRLGVEHLFFMLLGVGTSTRLAFRRLDDAQDLALFVKKHTD